MAKTKNIYSGFDEEVAGERTSRRYLNCAGKYLVRVVQIREDQVPDEGDAYVAATVQVMEVIKGGTKTITGDKGAKEVVDSDDPIEVGGLRECYWVTGSKWGKLGRRDAKLFIMRAAGVEPTSKEASEINGAFVAACALPEQPLRGNFLTIEKVLGVKGKKSEHPGDAKMDTFCGIVDNAAMQKKFASVPLPAVQSDDDDSEPEPAARKPRSGGYVPQDNDDSDIPF